MNLTDAVHQLESGGRMQVGRYGADDGGLANGPMQVHQPALTDYNAANGTNYTTAQLRDDPTLGLTVGAGYLAMQRAAFGSDAYALGAYNQGPAAMRAAIANGSGVEGLPNGGPSYVARGLALLSNGPDANATAPSSSTDPAVADPTVADPTVADPSSSTNAGAGATGSSDPGMDISVDGGMTPRQANAQTAAAGSAIAGAATSASNAVSGMIPSGFGAGLDRVKSFFTTIAIAVLAIVLIVLGIIITSRQAGAPARG